MKVLNRPMFRMGGPIKEGIMDGIEEPRVGFQNGTPPGFFGFTFDKPLSSDVLKGPKLLEKQLEKNISIAGEPDFSMVDLYKTPIIRGDLFASTSPVVPKNKNIEMVDQETITTADIDPFKDIQFKPSEFDTSDVLKIVDETKTETVPSKSKTIIPDRNRGKILSDPDKEIKTPEADSELLQKLGYDRAVKKGNYALVEAIRKGLTEGGVQGALDAAFAAGATDPYGEASKIKQAAALKEYERKTDLEDYEKKLKLKAKIDTKQYSDSVRTKDYNFAKNVLKMTDDEALAYANKSSSVAENVFKVTSKSQGGYVAPAQLGDAIRASGEKVDAVFEKDDAATIEAYSAKDGEYVVFNQKIFVGYKDPNSDEVLLKQIR